MRATSGLAEQLRETIIGPSVLRATSGLAEQRRETTIFGIFPLVASAIPYGNDEAKAHTFSSPSSPSSPVCQMEILAYWNSQNSQELD